MCIKNKNQWIREIPKKKSYYRKEKKIREKCQHNRSWFGTVMPLITMRFPSNVS